MRSSQLFVGGVAQMVERLLCMQEAQGSIPCSSTFFAVFPCGAACMAGRSVVVDGLWVVVGALAQW